MGYLVLDFVLALGPSFQPEIMRCRNLLYYYFIIIMKSVRFLALNVSRLSVMPSFLFDGTCTIIFTLINPFSHFLTRAC